jgi:hypothetical protein
VKLPRTGIEQPYMRDIPRFIDTHREFERIAVVNVSNLKQRKFLTINFVALTDLKTGRAGAGEWDVYESQ